MIYLLFEEKMLIKLLVKIVNSNSKSIEFSLFFILNVLQHHKSIISLYIYIYNIQKINRTIRGIFDLSQVRLKHGKGKILTLQLARTRKRRRVSGFKNVLCLTSFSSGCFTGFIRVRQLGCIKGVLLFERTKEKRVV